MKLVEYKVKDEIKINANEKVLSFAIDEDTIYFYSLVSDQETKLPPNRYVILDSGDDVEENMHHVATLVEGTNAKHIFIEYIPTKDSPKKKLTKIITSDGIEEIIDDENQD